MKTKSKVYLFAKIGASKIKGVFISCKEDFLSNPINLSGFCPKKRPDTKLELHKKEPKKLELQKKEPSKLELHKLEPITKKTFMVLTMIEKY